MRGWRIIAAAPLVRQRPNGNWLPLELEFLSSAATLRDRSALSFVEASGGRSSASTATLRISPVFHAHIMLGDQGQGWSRN